MSETPPPQEPGDNPDETGAEPQPEPPDEPVTEPDVEGEQSTGSAFEEAPNVDGHAADSTG